jgi:hypothetical protein
MSTPAVEPQPLILTNAGLKIGKGPTEADLVELACLANHIELSPDVSVTTIDTMCGSKDYPGQVKWALVATLYQSFDPDATEEVLSAAVEGGVPVPFAIVGYRDKPVGPTNPEWSGFLIPQPYAPINGDAGDASSVELEWSLSGDPVKSESPAAVMAAQSGYESQTLAELQALASDRGLPTSGTKAELAQRLAEADAAGT